MARVSDVECVLLQTFGGYTRATLSEEPAEWVLSMYRRLTPDEHQASTKERGDYQQSLWDQGLPPEEVHRRMRERW